MAMARPLAEADSDVSRGGPSDARHSEKPAVRPWDVRQEGNPTLPVFGLVGGIGAGKSQVARFFESLGAVVLDADRAAHEVLRSPEVEDAARSRWGNAIFGEDGRIDRGRLAEVVFAPAPEGPRELEYLEQLTHPRVGEVLSRQGEEAVAGGKAKALVVDAPMMLEAGWGGFCDKIVFVDASREVRLQRVLKRGWSEKEFAARESTQESLDVKRALADVVIENSGSLEETQAQVERMWQLHVK